MRNSTVMVRFLSPRDEAPKFLRNAFPVLPSHPLNRLFLGRFDSGSANIEVWVLAQITTGVVAKKPDRILKARMVGCDVSAPYLTNVIGISILAWTGSSRFHQHRDRMCGPARFEQGQWSGCAALFVIAQLKRLVFHTKTLA
jgi:hypothetical protein